ncbi:GNAT family N-acetyltransferase [Streptomyces sp. E-15]
MAHPTAAQAGGEPLPLPRVPFPPGAPALDNAVWAALTGPHAHLAERVGRAARYRAETYDFAAVADPADPAAWADLHTLLGPAAHARVKPVERVPEGWTVLGGGEGVQLVDTALRAEPAPEAVRLGPDDVPEILGLVARTRPGPFLRRTVEMGTYLGIRHRGRLVAMAGERLRLPGWTEISAVCTDPAHRGRGLATRLVRAVAAGIRERGDTPFLHVAADNAPAIRLYEAIGFTPRRRSPFVRLRSPGTSGAGRALDVMTRSTRRAPTRPAAPDGAR